MAELTDQARTRAEEILDYRFSDPQLLSHALTHSSVANNRRLSNERLEFLGDAVLGSVVCEYLFHNYPDYLEGELTKIKSTVVSRRVCAIVSRELGLDQLLLLGKGMVGRHRMPSSLAAGVYEAVVAAIYIDGGLEAARRFILEHLTPHIDDAADTSHQHNYKSVLQQYAQRCMTELPSYRLLDEKGPDHSKAFQLCVEIDGRRYPAAWGNNKKQAEQEAALLALKAMGLVAVEDDGRVVVHDDAD